MNFKKFIILKNIFAHFFALTKEFGLIPAVNIEFVQFLKTAQYKHKYILTYLEKHYSNIIDKYKTSSYPQEVIGNDDVIWVCWFQGEIQMPESIRHCFNSIKKYSGCHKVRLITWENFRQFVNIPSYIIEKVEKGYITYTHFSDILRSNLLADYGGIYIDAGLLLTDELQIPQLPFYSIKLRNLGNDYNFVSDYRWLAGFMAGVKSNAIHSFMKDFFNEYWKNENIIIDYFLVDYVIAVAYKNIVSVKEMVDSVPYFSSDIYYIGYNLFKPLRKSELDQVLRRCNIFRVGCKGFPEVISTDSLYHYLFN